MKIVILFVSSEELHDINDRFFLQKPVLSYNKVSICIYEGLLSDVEYMCIPVDRQCRVAMKLEGPLG